MGVRRAVADDVPEVARVQTDAWAATYEGLIPESIFALMTVDRRVEMWNSYFTNRPARALLLVAEHHDAIVGMASVGPCRDEDMGGDEVGEVFAIYVDPPYWGDGHGKALMIKSLEEMRTMGFELATLWVLDTNDRGRSFYERGGWRLDGAVKLDDSYGDPIREVRYRLEL